VSRVGYDDEVDLREDLLERIRRGRGADHVIATLDDRGGYVSNLIDLFLFEQLTVPHPAAVDKVMRLDPRERQRPFVRLGASDIVVVDAQLRSGHFPLGPRLGGFGPDLDVVGRETQVVGRHHVVALGFRDGHKVVVPCFGEDVTSTVLIEELELAPSKGEYATKDERLDAIGMRLSICQRQRRAPRSSKDDPLVDLEVLSQLLDV